MIYEWGHFKYPVDANIVMQEIGNINGSWDAKAVVDKARPKNAILHPCFTWDNKIAGEQWREQQARVMIGSIVRVSEDIEEPRTRAIVHIVEPATETTEKISRYVTIEEALSDDEMRKQLLKNALSELKSFQVKYHNLKKLDKLFSAIDEFVQQLEM